MNSKLTAKVSKINAGIGTVNKLFDTAQFKLCINECNNVSELLKDLAKDVLKCPELDSELRTIYLKEIRTFVDELLRTTSIAQIQVDTVVLPGAAFVEKILKTFDVNFGYYEDLVKTLGKGGAAGDNEDILSIEAAKKYFDIYPTSEEEPQIIGNDNVKNQILTAIAAANIPAQYQRIGQSTPYFILSGPPGTGKTMFGKFAAFHARKKLAILKMSKIHSDYQGQTEKNLAAVINALPELWTQNVVLFDEADTFFSERSDGGAGAEDSMYSRLVSESLPIFDKIAAKKDLPSSSFLFFTTNLTLDSALRRRSQEFYVDKPQRIQDYVAIFTLNVRNFYATMLNVEDFVKEYYKNDSMVISPSMFKKLADADREIETSLRLSPGEINQFVKAATAAVLNQWYEDRDNNKYAKIINYKPENSVVFSPEKIDLGAVKKEEMSAAGADTFFVRILSKDDFNSNNFLHAKKTESIDNGMYECFPPINNKLNLMLDQHRKNVKIQYENKKLLQIKKK